jgi:hypothetical protein
MVKLVSPKSVKTAFNRSKSTGDSDPRRNYIVIGIVALFATLLVILVLI